MRLRFLFGLLLISLSVSAKRNDTIPDVLYFDGNFQIRNVQQASYYGLIDKFENNRFKATLYTPSRQKVAIVEYAGKDRYRQGPTVGYYPSEKTQFIVNFNRGALDGRWISYYENGQVCDSGALLNNLPDGNWISYYENGQPRMIVKFNARKLIQVKDEMRRLYRGPTLPVTHTGSGSSPGLLRGQQAYARSQYLFLRTSTVPAQIVGRFNGITLKRKIDINTTQRFPYYAAPFEECLIHGIYKSYFPDGKLQDSGYSKFGLRTGVWQEYTPDLKNMSRGYYKKGFKRGEWRYYDADGKFLFLRRYNKFGIEKETIVPGGKAVSG